MVVYDSQSGWISEFKKRLQQYSEDKDNKSKKWTNSTIYRALEHYKEVNRNCFEPQIVSLGPFHSSNPKLRKAVPHKLSAVDCMLKRKEHEVCRYLDAMMELEPKARSCYDEHITQDNYEFAEMMLLDGCFILEFLRVIINGSAITDIPFPKLIVYFPTIMSDMLLLENQIPLFVLEKLAELQCIDWGIISNSIICMFNTIMSSTILNQDEDAQDSTEPSHPDHILDIVWQKLVVDIPNIDKDNAIPYNIPCVSKLKGLRIKFNTLESKEPLWNVKFNDRTLHLKLLQLDYRSKTLFCNLIAYEQFYFDQFKAITGYIIFMSKLIDSDEDVQHLIKCNIISNNLGSDNEVVKLFDDITKNTEFKLKISYLQTTVESINNHYNNSWYESRANLIETYFKTPWSTISVVAAFFLLVFTFIQTLYAVLGK